jgi:hypothetical protein
MRHPEPELLSQFLDGDLSAEEHQRLATHLNACVACSALLEDLRRVLARAQSLEDRPPRHDLWPGVAAAIGAAPPARRRLQVSVPMLLAASVALMVLSGGGVAMWMTARAAHMAMDSVPPAAAAPVPESPAVAHASRSARGYEQAIRSLEAQLEATELQLDTATARIVRQKLDVIDRALDEAQRALDADPSNSYLNGHLTATRLRKLDLLRRATALGRSVS